jgi:hypothetical protein
MSCSSESGNLWCFYSQGGEFPFLTIANETLLLPAPVSILIFKTVKSVANIKNACEIKRIFYKKPTMHYRKHFEAKYKST